MRWLLRAGGCQGFSQRVYQGNTKYKSFLNRTKWILTKNLKFSFQHIFYDVVLYMSIYYLPCQYTYIYLWGITNIFYWYHAQTWELLLRDSCSGIPLMLPDVPYLEMAHHKFMHHVIPLGLLKYGKVPHVMLQKWALGLGEMKLLLEKLGP